MIGTDYEGFLKINGTLRPVTENLNLGSKFGVHVQLAGGTMHRDNVMLELCVEPSDNVDTFVNNVFDLNRRAEKYLATRYGFSGVGIDYTPTARFDMKDLQSKEAAELGCDIDYLAVAAESIPRDRVEAKLLGAQRCAGGHIHMSYGCTDKIPQGIVASLCDVTLGTLELQMGTQGARRRHYGLAGLHRRKMYGKVDGVEYRTVSNLWLRRRSYAKAMATNALSLEAVLKHESRDKIGLAWRKLASNGAMNDILRLEQISAGRAKLQAWIDMFPNYKWETEVVHT